MPFLAILPEFSWLAGLAMPCNCSQQKPPTWFFSSFNFIYLFQHETIVRSSTWSFVIQIQIQVVCSCFEVVSIFLCIWLCHLDIRIYFVWTLNLNLQLFLKKSIANILSLVQSNLGVNACSFLKAWWVLY